MAINLSRNTRVWFTTNVSPVTGELTDASTGFSAANTQELQILDGFSFTQGTSNQVITLNEAGTNPVRGQRSFNTSLNPVDFSFSTYIRPSGSAAGTVTCAERVLWNAMGGSQALDTTSYTVVSASVASRTATTSPVVSNVVLAGTSTGLQVGDAVYLKGMGDTAWDSISAGPIAISSITASTNTTITGVYSKAPGGTSTSSTASGTTRYSKGQWYEGVAQGNAISTFQGSNKNQLQKFALIFLVDNAYYAIDNCALNQAVIDFGLDAISMIAWSGNGTKLKQLANITAAPYVAGSSTLGGVAVSAFNTSANYITNKLSTITLKSSIGGATTPTNYVVPITGGSITINNNINYITPANLGVVNVPIGYFTGTRSITGTLTAYLKTGNNTESGALLNAVIDAGAETKYYLNLEIGGISNSVRTELELQGVTLQVPTVEVADVVSTTINFTAQGSDANLANNTYDVTAANDLTVRYYSA